MTPTLIIKDDSLYRLRQGLNQGKVTYLNEQGVVVPEHQPYYEKIGTLEPITIHFLERPATPKTARPTLKNVSILPVQLGDKAAPGIIPYPLFRSIYEVIAVSGQWWPLEATYWPWKEFFSQQALYLLCYENKVAGFGCIDQKVNPEGKAKIHFLSVTPSVQGKGLGSYLFSYLHSTAYEYGARTIYLDTAPAYDKMPDGTPALEMYLKKGFVEYRKPETISPSCVLANPDTVSFGINQFNLPAYYHNNPLCDTAYLEQKLDQHWNNYKHLIAA